MSRSLESTGVSSLGLMVNHGCDACSSSPSSWSHSDELRWYVSGVLVGFSRRVDAASCGTASFMATVGTQSSEHGVVAKDEHEQFSRQLPHRRACRAPVWSRCVGAEQPVCVPARRPPCSWLACLLEQPNEVPIAGVTSPLLVVAGYGSDNRSGDFASRHSGLSDTELRIANRKDLLSAANLVSFITQTRYRFGELILLTGRFAARQFLIELLTCHL
jgi:hypothetical protein